MIILILSTAKVCEILRKSGTEIPGLLPRGRPLGFPDFPFWNPSILRFCTWPTPPRRPDLTDGAIYPRMVRS